MIGKDVVLQDTSGQSCVAVVAEKPQSGQVECAARVRRVEGGSGPVGFDFEASPVDQTLIRQLANLSFTETAQNLVLVGGRP